MDEIGRRFKRLAGQYYRETFFSSFFQADHPAMREIIAMGMPVLPYIFKEIEKGKGHWYYPIRQITGDRPPTITEEDAGKIRVLDEKYLQWGREQGYIEAEAVSRASLPPRGQTEVRG